MCNISKTMLCKCKKYDKMFIEDEVSAYFVVFRRGKKQYVERISLVFLQLTKFENHALSYLYILRFYIASRVLTCVFCRYEYNIDSWIVQFKKKAKTIEEIYTKFRFARLYFIFIFCYNFQILSVVQ